MVTIIIQVFNPLMVIVIIIGALSPTAYMWDLELKKYHESTEANAYNFVQKDSLVFDILSSSVLKKECSCHSEIYMSVKMLLINRA